MGPGQREPVSSGWSLCATPPGRCPTPASLALLSPDAWVAIPGPLPAAAALRAAGRFRLDDAPRRFDAEDWWYRATFAAPAGGPGDSLWLAFDGLAGAAEAWLNDEPLLVSDNLHVAHAVRIDGRADPASNTLLIRFQALDPLLAQRRARPAWRAPMIEHQQLRWWRTAVLGRTPGWSPSVPAVGPCGGVWLETRRGPQVSDLRLHSTLGADGSGQLAVSCVLDAPPGAEAAAELALTLERDGAVHTVRLRARGQRQAGELTIPQVAPWWPHTHGEPALYRARLTLQVEGAAAVDLPLPAVGFRRVEALTQDEGFRLAVNGERVFCRGACWMPLDPLALAASPEAERQAVLQARDAGMNMLRISGTTVYPSAALLDACDEFGMLLWQDFMFANMDYPFDDAAFLASVRTEARQQMLRWQGRPSLAVLCGNSEVEQQAAMWGAPRERWQPAFFHHTLRDWAAELLPGVPYWPSSAHGGAFPHQPGSGTASYYGVGAYLRALDDARRSDLKFATECLAFANVPDARAVARMPGGHGLRVHHPAWKARTPRDLAAGWDFEDVRDHYLKRLFDVDPVACRSADHERYLDLSRVVTGEVMARSFDEWRRPGSACGGALVWFLRDLQPGAGWGLLDELGRPKACFDLLRRALQPLSVSITDEGNNGLAAHVVNEHAQPFDGELEVRLHGTRDQPLAQARVPVRVGARGAATIALAACFDDFFDLSHAYRFAPSQIAAVQACLLGAGAPAAADAWYFPQLPALLAPRALGLRAQLEPAGEQTEVVVRADRLALYVHVEVEGHTPDDNEFHLAPGAERRVALRRDAGALAPATSAAGHVRALNGDAIVTLRPAP